MKTTDKIKEVISRSELQKTMESKTKAHNRFYDEMKRMGIAKKQEYNIAPTTDMGRRPKHLSMLSGS